MIWARQPSSFLGGFTNTRRKHLVEHDPGSRSGCAWIRSVGHQQPWEVCFQTSRRFIWKKKLLSIFLAFCNSIAPAAHFLQVFQRSCVRGRFSWSYAWAERCHPTSYFSFCSIQAISFYQTLHKWELSWNSNAPPLIKASRYPPCASICSSCINAPLHAAAEVKSIFGFVFFTFCRLQTMDRSIVNPFAPKEARRRK